nr:reverse transcriptase domain-containing protein [Tanacetum cinerariifolium]
MSTRSQSRNNFPQQEASPAIVEPLRIELPFLEDQFQEDPPEDPPEVPMADNQTMVKLLQAPTEGYEDAIVIPKIAANNFELEHGLINLIQNKQFFGHDKEDPHAHIRYFNKIASTMKVPNDSLNSAAGGNFLDKMPRECLKIIESKSKVRQSRAKAVVAKTRKTNPQLQLHLLLQLKQLSQIVLLAVVLTRTKIVNVYRDNIQEYVLQAAVANYNQGNTSFRPQMVTNQIRPPSFPLVQTHQNNQNNLNQGNNFNQNRGGPGTLPSNTITNPKEDLKGITTRSGVAYQGPTIPTPSKVTKQGTE